MSAADGAEPSTSSSAGAPLDRLNLNLDINRASAAPSSGSTSASSAASVNARYMIPVLTYGKPSASARPRASVLFPDPAAPSIAMTFSLVTSHPPRTRRAPRMASTNPGNDTSAASMPSISLGPSAASAPTANAIASRWSPPLSATPPRSPRPGTTRSSPSTPACPPSARSPSATPVSRSVSLARSSAAPVNHVSPRACAARTARMGTSSITSGSSDASITVPRRSAPGATHSSPTGSPSSCPVRRVSVRTPIRSITLQEVQPARVQPDARGRSAPSPSSAAAATRNAADETSPGTAPPNASC